MKRFEFSVSIQEEDGSSRVLKLELVPSGNLYQPVITTTDSRTGFSSVTRLPISDYTSLREKISKLFTLDFNGLEKMVRKIITMLSLFSQS